MAAGSGRLPHAIPSPRGAVRPRALSFLLLLAFSGSCVIGCGRTRPNVTFVFRQPVGAVDSVSITGSFNGWSSRANPLGDDDYDGVWETRLRLPPGRIEYKFVVNHRLWFTDWTAEDLVPDGVDGMNSVATVGARPLTLGWTTPLTTPPRPRGSRWREQTFTFRPAAQPDSVHLACFFNPWTPVYLPMRDDRGDGSFRVALALPPGKWPCAVVVNGYTWERDTILKGEVLREGLGPVPERVSARGQPAEGCPK